MIEPDKGGMRVEERMMNEVERWETVRHQRWTCPKKTDKKLNKKKQGLARIRRTSPRGEWNHNR